MSACSFILDDLRSGGREPVLDKVVGLEKEVEFNSTRSEDDIKRVVSEVQSTIVSTTASEELEDGELDKLCEQRELYLHQRSAIINSIWKRLFNRKYLELLDSKLEEIDYKIYLIESEQTKKLIQSLKQESREDSDFLAEIEKKYGF